VKRLILSVMLVFLISSTAVAANDACMKATADNQAKVEAFVMKVMEDPMNRYLAKPTFFQGLCQNYIAIMECKAIIKKVVKMADAGLVDKIEMPMFKYDGSE